MFFTGGSNTLNLLSGASLTGGIQIGGGGSLDFSQSGNYTLNNAIIGNGSVFLAGPGTLILNGVNTYSGGTTISGGTLEVGDINTPTASIIGNVLVNAGGTLRGHGIVGGDVNNIGVVWPGGSIGTLTINGNYTQSASGTLKIDVSPTVASQLKVGGTANLNGTLDILYGPGTYSSKTYRIVQAGAVNGKFTTVTGNAPAGFDQGVTYSANAVDLDLTNAPVVVAPSNATIFGGLGSATLREAQRVNGALLDRLGDLCASVADTGCAHPGKRLWVQAGGTFSHVDGNHGAPNTQDNHYGILAGVDRVLGAWTVGVAGGYSHGDVSETTGDASGKIDTLRLAVYGGRGLGPVDVAGTVGYAYDFVSTQRDFGSLGSTNGTGHAQELTAGLQASLPVPFATKSGVFTLTPRVGLRYAYVDGLGLAESGLASQRLSVDDQTLNSLQPYVGLTLDYAFTPHNSERTAHVQARLGYAYETQGGGRDVSVTAGDGTGFTIPGTTDSRGLATAGLGANLPLGKVATLYAHYDAVLPTGNVRAQAVRVGVDYRF